MRKRILVFLLCGVFAVGLVGCGSSSKEEESASEEEDTEEKSAKEEDSAETESEEETEEEVAQNDAAEESEEEAAQEEPVEEETEEAEPLSPEEYIEMTSTYCDTAEQLAADIAEAGQDLYMYYASESTTSDEVQEKALSDYEDNTGNAFESIGDTLGDLTEALSVLKNVPEDETCEKWYEDIILPLNTDLIDLYALVYEDCANYLPGSLANSRAFKEEYDSLTEDLDNVIAAHAAIKDAGQSE